MKTKKHFFTFLRSAGYKYWTASLLPATVGITLPFWIKPPEFTFQLFNAIEFLFAILICHVGFSLILKWFKFRDAQTNKKFSVRTDSRHLLPGLICIIIVMVLGIHLNSNLTFPRSVYPHIFIVYGVTALFAGVLYVFPPFSFYKRAGGEVILYFGLGMLPILGAYLAQVGDLTRTVYIASIPIVVVTGLWIWVKELIQRPQNEISGHQSAVMLFPSFVSGRFITPIIVSLIYLTLIIAVFGRPTLHPFSLFAFISLGFGYRIIMVCRNAFDRPEDLLKVESYPMIIHLILCVAIIISSLLTAY